MDDLISRQEAIDRLSEVLSSEEEFEKAKQAILEAPIAYNVDKVVLKDLLEGKWVETEKVQNAFGMTFEECFKIFEFSRTAEWWSIVGETEEERQRNGQKISTYFRLKAGGVNE